MNLDTLLSIGETSDWISPLCALIQDLVNGPHCRFYVDRGAGFSVSHIKSILKGGGIKFWGDMIADGLIIVTVPESQADEVSRVLYEAGVPVIGWV